MFLNLFFFFNPFVVPQELCSKSDDYIVAIIHPGASNNETPSKDLQNLTVERLRALLKAKGLSLRGKKVSIVILQSI